MDRIRKLQDLYDHKSKHSQYQPLPRCLREVLNINTGKVKYHYETERLDYVKNKINPGDRIVDIGGNSGFFTFELLDAGVEHVDYYEGDASLADFVKLASEILDLTDRITVHNEYYDFDNPTGLYDTILCFNVIHHLGTDFNTGLNINTAKTMMLRSINKLTSHASYLVFQMGFNWGGDITKNLFEHGTKREVVDYVTKGVRGFWSIHSIGIPVMQDDKIHYVDIGEDNLERIDEYGEFLNRPLFILKSEVYNNA